MYMNFPSIENSSENKTLHGYSTFSSNFSLLNYTINGNKNHGNSSFGKYITKNIIQHEESTIWKKVYNLTV
jgi:hypothetical protein